MNECYFPVFYPCLNDNKVDTSNNTAFRLIIMVFGNFSGDDFSVICFIIYKCNSNSRLHYPAFKKQKPQSQAIT